MADGPQAHEFKIRKHQVRILHFCPILWEYLTHEYAKHTRRHDRVHEYRHIYIHKHIYTIVYRSEACILGSFLSFLFALFFSDVF